MDLGKGRPGVDLATVFESTRNAARGTTDAARAQWRIAGGLDLTADERARLSRDIARSKA